MKTSKEYLEESLSTMEADLKLIRTEMQQHVEMLRRQREIVRSELDLLLVFIAFMAGIFILTSIIGML